MFTIRVCPVKAWHTAADPLETTRRFGWLSPPRCPHDCGSLCTPTKQQNHSPRHPAASWGLDLLPSSSSPNISKHPTTSLLGALFSTPSCSSQLEAAFSFLTWCFSFSFLFSGLASTDKMTGGTGHRFEAIMTVVAGVASIVATLLSVVYVYPVSHPRVHPKPEP